MDAFQLRQLRFVVHTFSLPRSAGMRGDHFAAFARRERHDVGQIVFTLGVLISQIWQPTRQCGCRRNQYAGIDFCYGALGIVGVFFFDDAFHLPVDAHDAAVAMRIGCLHSEQGEIA